MIQAMYSGISGMKAFKTSLDVIGNNIANVNTIGYKTTRITFKDMLSQTMSGASGPSGVTGGKNPSQVGLGVVVGATDVDNTQGSMTATGRQTDLAIEGNGYFALGSADKVVYTRDGSFTLDANNNLVSSSSGMRVLGWTSDATTGELDTSTTITGSSAINIPVGSLSVARATSTVNLGGNLDASWAAPRQTTLIDFMGNLDSAAADGTVVSKQVTIYDSEGDAHDVTLSLTKNGADTWDYTVACPDATAGSLPAPGQITFDPVTGAIQGTGTISLSLNWQTPNGSVEPLVADIDLTDVTQLAANSTFALNTQNGAPLGEPYPVKFDVYDSLGLTHEMEIRFTKQSEAATWQYDVYIPDVDATNPVATGDITFDTKGYSEVPSISISSYFADENGSFQPWEATIDTSRLSQLNGQNTVSLNYQDGLPLGTLESFNVDRSGKVFGTFTNGANRILGQVALAEFSNPAGLTRIGNNQLVESPNSGTPRIGVPGSGSLGLVTSGFLEASNVDLANEFANMIVAQRGFQANSRIISVSDDVLQEVVTLKR